MASIVRGVFRNVKRRWGTNKKCRGSVAISGSGEEYIRNVIPLIFERKLIKEFAISKNLLSVSAINLPFGHFLNALLYSYYSAKEFLFILEIKTI